MPKPKILIADDEVEIRHLVRKALERDYTIIEAVDGMDAMDKATSEKPALIFMDIMMPVLDGYKACYLLKLDEQTRGIPVVMLTGIDYELNRKLGEQFGASVYITKPFQIIELKQTIKRLIPNT